MVKISFINLIIVILFTYTTAHSQTSSIIYVACDGSGDFNCDGTSDQKEINQALDFVAKNSDYSTVYLKGSKTFWIDGPILISSNTILEGDSNSVIKLIDNAAWETQFKPIIGQKGMSYSLEIDQSNKLENITIRNFEIDGNKQNQKEPSGNSYYNMISLQNCNNIVINNMYMHDNLSDIVNINNSNYYSDINMKFFNNRVHASGHDGIYVGKAINFEIYNNNFSDNRTDAHVRAQNCNQFKIYNNVCGNNPNNRNSGGIGVDIQVSYDFELNDVEVFNNYLYGKGAFHGIWLWQTSDGGYLESHKNVHIHHNIITGSQGSGIGIFGFHNTLIEYNVIEFNGKGNNNSFWDNVPMGKNSGITFYEGGNKNKIKGFKTTVRNNIIGNNNGYGIENKKPQLHEFILSNNCIYNNGNGNYKNASSNSDIYINPDYASNTFKKVDSRIDYSYNVLNVAWKNAEDLGDFSGDLNTNEARQIYHLKSELGRWNGFQWVYDDVTSFCINTGNPFSDYSNEPIENGGRVNIGAFGNTIFASKSDKIPDVHSFMVYPNPSNGFITISEEFINNKYYVYLINGRLVQKGFIETNQLDLSYLEDGIYLIKIKMHNSNNWRIGKFIKIN